MQVLPLPCDTMSRNITAAIGQCHVKMDCPPVAPQMGTTSGLVFLVFKEELRMDNKPGAAPALLLKINHLAQCLHGHLEDGSTTWKVMHDLSRSA